ncbi:MAG TPA: phosphoadenylyl-sulfate reductase [Gemmatimonadales bacterium]|nr:phosphoadenylyl-sulfate reductase [Gemmatimonadales bacterium]
MRIVREIDTDIGEESPPERVVGWLLQRFAGRRLVVTTGFGMEGCALLDMLARQGGTVPVLYLDTGFLFPETLRLRDRLAERYPGLRFERRAPSLTPEAQEVNYGPELWTREPDTCCSLRKVEPMREALDGVDVWVTGLMRSQSPSREGLRVVEWDWQYQLLKVNPLATWDRARVWEYVQQYDVPYNELHDRGYPTLGCTHCTLPVAGTSTGEYTREGRWQGRSKLECGLHQIVGRQMTA